MRRVCYRLFLLSLVLPALNSPAVPESPAKVEKPARSVTIYRDKYGVAPK